MKLKTLECVKALQSFEKINGNQSRFTCKDKCYPVLEAHETFSTRFEALAFFTNRIYTFPKQFNEILDL